MKQIVLLLLFAGLCYAARADHITGGEMYYTYAGNINGEHQYRFTVKLFMRCNSGREFVNPSIVSAFEKGTNARVKDQSISLVRRETLSLTDPNKCITNPPSVCYEVGYYEFTLSLPASASGYIVACQFVFRIAGIKNLIPVYTNIGTTYTAEIPATTAVDGAEKNSSAQFTGTDLVIVCANNSFSYSFAAKDNDGDVLRYSFCNAYQGGSFNRGSAVAPTSPPFQPVPYGTDFSGSAPLGSHVRINAENGLITGIAPGEGIYVVTVCVEEIRNGVVIATQRKDLQIFISSCTIAAASLKPEYHLCRDSKTLSLSNLSTSPLIRTYNWDVYTPGGAIIAASASPTLTHTFSDTGQYYVRLTINRGQECADSLSSLVRVYPGLVPDFSVNGICLNRPSFFSDGTTSVYGQVASWKWSFGEGFDNNTGTGNPNPQYQFRATGPKQVRLIVADTKGCVDTVSKQITILEKPLIDLAFRDTLICRNDQLQLQATGTGQFSWTPQQGISHASTASPTVAPAATTTYYVHLNDNGCLNSDSVVVRVVNEVQVQAMPDTAICTGDTIQLRLTSNALHYTWTPAAQVFDPAAAHPLVRPRESTTYEVTARIGGCTAKEQVRVFTVPYPQVHAGQDTLICYNSTVQLNGTTNGRTWAWQPEGSLYNAQSLNPLANPAITTAYVLSAFDNQGCPKPASDTVVVTVLPPIRPYAGRDTVVVVGQPLQLNASGGTRYRWTTSENLSATDIPNPVAVFSAPADRVRFKVEVFNEAGCSDSAFVAVRVFKALPSVFVPTAFTPNNDGLNEVLRPLAVGMQRIEVFAVYNRWGQLVFQSQDGKGWDGTINGQPQKTGVFVWLVKAVDFTGRAYVQKGTVTLIR